MWQVYRISSLCPQAVIGPQNVIISQSDYLEIMLLTLIDKKNLLGLGDHIRALAGGGVLGPTQVI